MALLPPTSATGRETEETMLRHLNNQEMLALTSTWSSNPAAKATFLSIPEIAPLHPKVVKVTAEMLAIQPASSEDSSELQEVLAESTQLDVEHDMLARAVSLCVEADRAFCLASKPPEPRRAQEAEKVHAKLFPTGLSIVNASLLAESGNTMRIAALLEAEPAVAEHLEAIPLRDGRTVLDLTRRWVTTGKKLGKLEHRRSVLAAKQSTKPVDLSTFGVVRGRWLRLVSQVLSTLELSDAPEEAIEIIRGPVLVASERAGRRYATDSSTPEVASTPEPEREPVELLATA